MLETPQNIGPTDVFSETLTYDCSSALDDGVPGEKGHLPLKNGDAPPLLLKNVPKWAKTALFAFFFGGASSFLAGGVISPQGSGHSTQNYNRK